MKSVWLITAITQKLCMNNTNVMLQFHLHLIILNYNHFVCNSVDNLNCWFFPLQNQLWARGVVSFPKIRTFERKKGSLLCKNAQTKGEGDSKKGQFYVNVIVEWLLYMLTNVMQQLWNIWCYMSLRYVTTVALNCTFHF